MSSVRRSKWPLPALALALVALGGEPSRAQDADLADLRLRVPPGDETGGALPKGADAPDDAAPKPKPKAPKKPRPGDLPPLRPYPGAQRLGLRGGPPDPNLDASGAPLDLNPPGPTIAVPEPAPKRRKIPEDEKPFDPVGLRVGDFDIKPYFEQDIGYATNPLGAVSDPRGSLLSTSEAGVGWQSVGGRDDLHGQIKGGYNDYFATPEASGSYGSGTVDGKIEATRDLVFDDEGRFAIAPQSLSNFGVAAGPGGTTPYVTVATFGGTVGATETLGKLSLGLHGSADRESYQNAALFGTDGRGLAADDYNDYGLKFRAAYRITEALSPFVEFGADTRRYDNGTDALGYLRDSDGVTGKAGVTLTFSQLLTGEASVGYGERTYRDPRLAAAGTPLIDASLIWSVTPLTTITLKAQSELNDSILAGASADINRAYTIDISHALTRALTLGLTGTYGTDDYVGVSGRDVNESLGVKAEYHINRDVVLKASAAHQIYQSNQPNQGSVGDVFLMGVRVQR